MLNGFYCRLPVGSPSAEFPARYGPAPSCYDRFVRWRMVGVWEPALEAISKAYKGDVRTVERPSIRVHRRAVDGERRAAGRRRVGRRHPMYGRSRGRLTTGIRALIAARGLPIALKLTLGASAPRQKRNRHAWYLEQGRRAAPPPWARQRCASHRNGRARRLGQHQAHAEPQASACPQRLPLTVSQPRRALLRSARTLPFRCHRLRKAQRQRPRTHQTRRPRKLAARIMHR